jgi:hypothetical protein
MLHMRGFHAWLARTTEGLPAAPPYLIHEMYFASRRDRHRVRHRLPFVRCRRAIHRTVGNSMNG